MSKEPFLSRRSLLVACGGLVTALGLNAVPVLAQEAAPSTWIISPASARALIQKGALVVDIRSRDLRSKTPIAGAVPAAWQDFSEADRTRRGSLLVDDKQLTAQFQKIGVSQDRPVVALGMPMKGWGEDARLVWSLRDSGHDKAYLVDGGVDALLAGGPIEIASVPTPGDFVVKRRHVSTITKEEILAVLGRPDVVILDTREAREFQGQTPYGESRGGHIPGARHLYFRDLLDKDGRLLQGEALQAVLRPLGIGAGTQVISYCTAGIRSAYVTAVLRDMGIDAKNYDASMAEWAASDPAVYQVNKP
jgi:thiosulfate/3-mercaptopyruvate sulfurtransferase